MKCDRSKRSSWVVGLVLLGLVSAALIRRSPDSKPLPAYRRGPDNPTRGLEEWQVVKVSDGDTLKVQRNGQALKLRLCGIDAPEKAQDLGAEATAKLWALVDESGGWVMVDAIETDRYGRTVAEVWSDEVGLINSEMVGVGMAYVYERYVGGCPSKKVLQASEKDAKDYRQGVWGQVDAKKPWDYRKL